MRKNRKTLVCGILALAMILTGTGYALWSDTLNVTTTATTGEFDVTFVDLGLLAQYTSDINVEGNVPVPGWSIVDGISGEIIDPGSQEALKFEGFIDDSFFARGIGTYNGNPNLIAEAGTKEAYIEYARPYSSIDFDAELVDAVRIPHGVGSNYTIWNTDGSDQIAIDIENMYPGYAQAFRTDIINLGSMAAKLTDIKFAVGAVEGKAAPSEEVLGMLGIALLVQNEYLQTDQVYDNDRAGSTPVFGLCNTMDIDAEDIFTVGNVDFLRLSALDGMSATDVENALMNDTILAFPGATNRMDLFLGVAMDPDMDGTYTSGTAAARAAAEAAGETVADDTASQGGAAKITIDLLWSQFNEGVDPADAPANILDAQNEGATF